MTGAGNVHYLYIFLNHFLITNVFYYKELMVVRGSEHGCDW